MIQASFPKLCVVHLNILHPCLFFNGASATGRGSDWFRVKIQLPSGMSNHTECSSSASVYMCNDSGGVKCSWGGRVAEGLMLNGPCWLPSSRQCHKQPVTTSVTRPHALLALQADCRDPHHDPPPQPKIETPSAHFKSIQVILLLFWLNLMKT